MIEENEQSKKNEKKTDSSDEMIDSFFGSHSFDETSDNQTNTNNYNETEKLVDKILQETPQDEDKQNELKPMVDIKENDSSKVPPVPSVEQLNALDNNDQKKTDEHFFTPNDKEEIFEIDKPKDPVVPNKKKTENKQKKDFHRPRENKKKSGAKRFSFNLPKINIKLKKKKTDGEKTNKAKPIQPEKQKKSLLKQKKPVEENKESTNASGRIHGVSQIVEKDPQKQKHVKTKRTEQHQPKEKKSFFDSKNKSLNPFKKKIDSKNEETERSNTPLQFNENEQNQKIKTSSKEDGTVDEEVIQLLKITDDLLGKLPEDVIEEFSQSEDFSLYEKVMKKYEIVK
jgi:hypothetical protein